MRQLSIFTLILMTLFLLSCNEKKKTSTTTSLQQIDAHTIKGPKNFYDGYQATPQEGWVNVVVEIPTGTCAKWEVEKKSGLLKWEFKNGKPRVVKFLGYPGNYGMIPCTLLSKSEGGDGDPLDVLILGDALTRGSVVKVKPLGLLKLLDDDEIDDKIIAVTADSPFMKVKNLEALKSEFPGVLNIIETWFTSYKGPDNITSKGYADDSTAMTMIQDAAQAFEKAKN